MIPLSKIYKLDRFGVKLCGMEELLIFFCNTLSSKKFSPHTILGSFPSGSAVKNPPANAGDAGDVGSIPGLGRSLEEGNSNPLQVSGLGNLHGQRSLEVYGPWGCKKSDTT